FLFLGIFFAHAGTGYSQGTKLTLNLRSTTVREVCEQIEKQSNFIFVFSDDAENALNKKINISANSEEIKDVLDALLSSTQLSYKILDKQIVVYNNEKKQEIIVEPSPTPQQEQTKTIAGKVMDAKGQPLPGVTVTIKGTTRGTVTDVDGNYSLNNIANNNTLIFSFVGMDKQEINIGNKTSVDVTMKESAVALQEVVAVGYGTQKKINLTGAVSQINYENPSISSRPVTNVSSSLAGLSPGMIIRQGDGTPSSDAASIRIRGIGSLNASQNPLVIIDGQPMSIDDINPSDIASISVLKDAASAAIYGGRASNGVILITTKSGKQGEKIRINYTGNIGFLSPTKLTDFISNTADHMTLINQIQQNSGLTAMYSQNRIDEWREKSKTDVLFPNTNWWDVLLKNNSIQNHNISARGGSDRINFYTSIGYMNNNGIIDNTSYERYTFRSNLNFKVNDYLSFGTNVTALLGKADPVSVNQLFIHFDANSPGGLPKYQGKYGATMTGQESPGNNPIAIIENYKGEQNTQKYTGKFFATITPLQGWDINGSYFVSMNNYNDWTFLHPYELWDFQTSSLSTPADPNPPLSNSYSKQQNYIIDLYSNYSKTIRNHHLNLMIGYNQEYYKSQNFNATKTGLLDYEVLVLSAATTPTVTNGSATDYASRSYFGRVNYNYLDKYLFEVNIRRDGSSRFGPDKRWGTFPSFSGGWRISEEPFWNEIKDIVNYSKIRASWGQLGNNGIGNYEWQDVFQSANYSLNGSIVSGLAPSAIANNIITWETTDVLDIGVDFNLFNRFTFSFDYYNKYSHGILVKLPIPFVNGGLSAPRVNSGKVRNTGFEGDIKYDTRIGDFAISMGVNGNINKNIL
ncbi:MAG TPA: SusC/RagA family TonB-linked outer membrane protein, partial [Bacteroidetes bacterium]|nr:SusC/RagA family TonB-linked outer membrane protein [Bacteroidota bacterium]